MEEGEFYEGGDEEWLKPSSNYLSNKYQPVGDVQNIKVHQIT